MSFRTYHAVTGTDASQLGGQVEAQRQRVRARLQAVRRVVAVASGKGGVGKSWITVALALGAAARGQRVALLDADLKAPTAARLLGASGPLRVDEHGVHPAEGRGGVRVLSSDLLLSDGAPLMWRARTGDDFAWRTLLETGMLRELLGDGAWGELDLLLVDLPPDVDRLADLAALAPSLAGVVMVTIPSEESRAAVRRALRRASDAGIPLLGVVENMAGQRCARCGEVSPLFAGDAGAWLSGEFAVPLLARVPFAPGALDDPDSRVLADLRDALRRVLR